MAQNDSTRFHSATAAVAGGGLRARRVGHRAACLEIDQQPAFVADRDAIPTAGLADDTGGRHFLGTAIEALGDEARALARRRLFLDSAHDDQAQVGGARPGAAEPRAGRDERRERPFGIDGAAAVEDVAPLAGFDANRYLAGDGVDVTEQHDDARRSLGAELRHRVAGVVDERAIVAGPARLLDQPRGRLALFARERTNSNQTREQRDSALAIHQRLSNRSARRGGKARCDVTRRAPPRRR